MIRWFPHKIASIPMYDQRHCLWFSYDFPLKKKIKPLPFAKFVISLVYGFFKLLWNHFQSFSESTYYLIYWESTHWNISPVFSSIRFIPSWAFCILRTVRQPLLFSNSCRYSLPKLSTITIHSNCPLPHFNTLKLPPPPHPISIHSCPPPHFNTFLPPSPFQYTQTAPHPISIHFCPLPPFQYTQTSTHPISIHSNCTPLLYTLNCPLLQYSQTVHCYNTCNANQTILILHSLPCYNGLRNQLCPNLTLET